MQSNWAREVYLATSKQKWQYQMLPSLDDYLHAKNLRQQLIPSRDIDNQRILQYGWTSGKTDHTQPKMVVSMLTPLDEYLYLKI